MNPRKIREAVFVIGLCVLGGLTAVQLVRSVPHAAMFYMAGVALLLVVLEPFAGLIVYLVFYYVKPWLLIPGFSDAPVLLVVGAATFVSMLISKGIERRGTPIVKAPQDYLLIWFFVAILASHLVNGRADEAFARGYGFLHTIVLYLIITNTVSTERRLNAVAQCLGVLTLWVAVQGVIVHFRGTGLGGVEAIEGGRVRVIGFSSDPNILAGGLAMLVPLFFLELTRPRDVLRTLYAGAAVALLCYGVFLTNSRGGALTLALVGTLLMMRKIGVAKGVVLGLVLAGALYVFGPSRVQELNVSEPSAIGRLVAWKRAFGEFGGSPLFGIGSHRSGASSSGEMVALVPHNAFMQTAAELGIFGLLPWVLLIFASMKNLVFVSRNAGESAYGRLGLLSDALFFGCLAWNVSLMFAGSPYLDELYIMLGLGVAAAQIFVQGSSTRYQLLERKDVGYAILLIGFVLGLHGLVLLMAGV